MAAEQYHHDRYFIGRPSVCGPWEVGDRENGCDQIAECSSKAKAVRVWRALVAMETPEHPSLAELEVESLREGLASNEIAYLDLQCELAEANYRLRRAMDAAYLLKDAINGVHRSIDAPAQQPKKRRRKP